MSREHILYTHISHPHVPKRITRSLAEQALTGFNMKIAAAITRGLGTMICAYCFAFLALIGFPGLHATIPQYVGWLSQTFIQLTALSVLAVGQQVLSRHQELQADETYQTTQKIYHEMEQLKAHLAAQDAVLLDLQQGVKS